MKKAAAKKMAKVMHEFKMGTLHAGANPKGPKKAPLAKSRKQAIAIAMSEAGMAKKAVKKVAKKSVKEKKTGEVYSSRKAMMKHEKSEGAKERKREYGGKKGMR